MAEMTGGRPCVDGGVDGRVEGAVKRRAGMAFGDRLQVNDRSRKLLD